MKLYQVVSEDGTQYVEAESFGAAVKLWRMSMIAEYGTCDENGAPTGWDNDSEPETVACVSEEVVIR